MTEVVQESKSITVDITPQTLYKKYIKWVSPILGISSQLEADVLEYICLYGLNSDTHKQLNITLSQLSEVVSSLQGKRLLTLEGKPGDMVNWEMQNISQLKVTFEIA